MSTLHDALAARAHALAAATPPAPESASELVQTVKRRVRAKFAIGTGATLAVVAAAIFATLVVLGPNPVPPVSSATPTASPTPSTTPSASPTPEVTVDADGRALPGFVTVAEDLPGALALPAGMLESSQPGWVLGLYRPEVTTSGMADHFEVLDAAQHQVVYLVNPDGTRYQVLELPPTPRIVLGTWDAGSTTAVVGVCPETDSWPCETYDLARLDLTTGTIDANAFKGVPSARILATYPGGAALWTLGDSGLLLTSGTENTQFEGKWELWDSMPDDGMSPSGGLVIINSFDDDTQETTWAVVDLEAQTLTPVASPSGYDNCWADGWSGSTTVALDCQKADDDAPSYWAVDVATGASEPSDALPTPWFSVGPKKPSVIPNYFLADDQWVGQFTNDEQERTEDYEPEFGVANDGQYRMVPVPYPGLGDIPTLFARAKQGSLIYIEGSFASADANYLVALSAYDAQNDTVTLLFPYPPGGATTKPDAEGNDARGLYSWAVAR